MDIATYSYAIGAHMAAYVVISLAKWVRDAVNAV